MSDRHHTARRLRVAILGAGAAGLCAAVEMQRLGVDFTIYEKSDGVGGTWRANTYPGAACDIPADLYSFSFAPRHDWGRRFPEQPEILAYFEGIADDFGLRRHLRTGAEITEICFDESAATWSLGLDDGEVVVADVVITGLGQLSRPYIPQLTGLDAFAGPVFHSARWRHDCELSGLSVGVIGSGASAIQFVPRVAEIARHVTVFQRSPNWIVPKPDREIDGWRRILRERLPIGRRLARWWVYWRLELNYRVMLKGSVIGRALQRFMVPRLERLVDESLPREAVVPDYSPGCKRILISNDWYPTICRADVSVEVSPIDHVESDGIVTADQRTHPVDVIVFATGFRSTEFLAPMSVTGRGGFTLQQAWSGGPETYLGMNVAGFPNFFMLYGPNTNLGHNSIIFMIETQMRYVSKAIRHLLADELAWIDVRPEVMKAYDEQVQHDAAATVWAGDCSNWYKDASGRIVNNWPRSTIAYRLRTRRFVPGEYTRRTLVGR